MFVNIYVCIYNVVIVIVVVFHIQRIGCQPEKKYFYTVANPARGLLNRGKKRKKEKSLEAHRSSLHSRCLFGENKIKITQRVYMPRRYAGLGPSRVRTRITSTRRLGQWVSLRKTLCFRVRLQLSQSRCVSLLPAMSSRVYLFFPPRGHEPPPTLRGHLNPHLSL